MTWRDDFEDRALGEDVAQTSSSHDRSTSAGFGSAVRRDPAHDPPFGAQHDIEEVRRYVRYGDGPRSIFAFTWKLTLGKRIGAAVALLAISVTGGAFLAVNVSLRTEALRAPVIKPAHAAIQKMPEGPMERLPLESIRGMVDDPDANVRHSAVLELGRRGAGEMLEELTNHKKQDVQAAVPAAVLQMGRSAHAQVPWLAKGLTSKDEEVRSATASALRVLVSRYGPYQMPRTPEDEGQPKMHLP